jgi:hypothetical protein
VDNLSGNLCFITVAEGQVDFPEHELPRQLVSQRDGTPFNRTGVRGESPFPRQFPDFQQCSVDFGSQEYPVWFIRDPVRRVDANNSVLFEVEVDTKLGSLLHIFVSYGCAVYRVSRGSAGEPERDGGSGDGVIAYTPRYSLGSSAAMWYIIISRTLSTTSLLGVPSRVGRVINCPIFTLKRHKGNGILQPGTFSVPVMPTGRTGA